VLVWLHDTGVCATASRPGRCASHSIIVVWLDVSDCNWPIGQLLFKLEIGLNDTGMDFPRNYSTRAWHVRP